ncbi:MAG: hypothetical protein IT440_07740, partial [Phycisphaeraceae bacterium]|nr:hypothetical protein [Phycisphaeraceae bacterium]
MHNRHTLMAWGLLMVILAPLHAASSVDDAHWKQADEAMNKGLAFLRAHQNADGSWSPQPGPAITAMVLRVMLARPDIDTTDPAVRR